MQADSALGRAALTLSGVLVAVMAPPAGAQDTVTFRAVSVGGTYTCALSTSGTAYCWGMLPLEGDAFRLAPIAARRDVAFRHLSAGPFHICGVTTADEVYCWSDKGNAALGAGDTLQPAAAPVVGGLRFASVTVGYLHTCGVTLDSLAFCWGSNGLGQLGVGRTSNASEAAPARVSTDIRFLQLAAGAVHTCGLAADSTAHCWGAGSAKPAKVWGGRRFAIISSTSHNCGVTADGAAYCWGANNYGQLGSGRTGPQGGLVRVADESNLVFATVSAGAGFTCGVTPEGVAYCWGRNDKGQLGTGTRSGSPTPVAVAGDLRFASVSAGTVHACGVTLDGAVFCWAWAAPATWATAPSRTN